MSLSRYHQTSGLANKGQYFPFYLWVLLLFTHTKLFLFYGFKKYIHFYQSDLLEDSTTEVQH
jgi:hypothetical protein